MKVTLFTLDEANALVPTLETLVEEARRLEVKVKEAREQLEDLRIVWGAKLDDKGCPARAERDLRTAELHARRLELEAHLKRFSDLGVELKGVDLGLVDFFALNGDRLVYLCWRFGEKEIKSWHTLSGGFAGRRPIPESIRHGVSG